MTATPSPFATPPAASDVTSLHPGAVEPPEAIEPPKGTVNANPTGIGLLALLGEDYRAHGAATPGFFAVALHRLGNARMSVRSKALRAPLTLAYRTAFTAVNWGWGIDLCYSVPVGRRVILEHHGGMVLGPRRIGNDVRIRHNTTMGLLSSKDRAGKPVIEDGVEIGAGACIAGAVTVGARTVVGANSLVIRDVPPDSTVMGVPARSAKLR